MQAEQNAASVKLQASPQTEDGAGGWLCANLCQGLAQANHSFYIRLNHPVSNVIFPSRLAWPRAKPGHWPCRCFGAWSIFWRSCAPWVAACANGHRTSSAGAGSRDVRLIGGAFSSWHTVRDLQDTMDAIDLIGLVLHDLRCAHFAVQGSQTHIAESNV